MLRFLDANTRVALAVWLRSTVWSTVRTSSGRTSPSETYWLPHNTAETDGGRSKVDVINLATLELSSLNATSGLSLTSVHTAGAHWLTDAVPPFEIQQTVFGTDRLKPMV